MKYQFSAVVAMLASTTAAHSWLECVDASLEGREEMIANPPGPYDFPIKAEKCNGFPKNIGSRAEGVPGSGIEDRTLVAPLNWVTESQEYSYGFDEYEDPNDQDTRLACKACQRGDDREGALPAATAVPGQKLLMRHWGNGHSTSDGTWANPKNRHPGVIRIYWAGKKDTPLKYYKDLNQANWIPGAQAPFQEGAITYYGQEPAPGRPEDKLMKEHANYFEFTVPEDIETGTHKMVWGWAWKDSLTSTGTHSETCDKNVYDDSFDLEYGTCFDLVIKDGSIEGASKTQAAQYEAKKDTNTKSDVCSLPCQRGGQEGDAYTCDPTTETCPSCRLAANELGVRGCFDQCSDWIVGTDCSGVETSKVKARSAHKRRNHKHRRAL